jgi:hypothetical protein
MLGLLVLAVMVGSTIWIGFDASKRDWNEGSSTAVWVIGSLLLWIVVFPLYLVKRRRVPIKGGTIAGESSSQPHPAYVHQPPPPPPTTAVPLAPPGWYPDPHESTSQRYWSGSAWTEHTSTGAPQPTAVGEPLVSLRPPEIASSGEA